MAQNVTLIETLSNFKPFLSTCSLPQFLYLLFIYWKTCFEFHILNFQTQNINSRLLCPTVFVKFIVFWLMIFSLLLPFLFHNALILHEVWYYWSILNFFLCIFWFSDWFMMYLLFHLSGSSTSNYHFRISSSGFQTFHSLLLHLNLLACWGKSLRLPLLISSLLSFCTRNMFVLKNIILITFTGDFYCVGTSLKNLLLDKNMSASFTAYLWRFVSNAFFSVL